MVTTAWRRFHEHRDNGLVSDVFKDQALMNRLKGIADCRPGGVVSAKRRAACVRSPSIAHSNLHVALTASRKDGKFSP